MYNIAICDDCPTMLDKAAQLTTEYMQACQYQFTIAKFTNADALLFEIEGGTYFDFYLLDIIMPNENGISLAKNIKLLQPQANIIFTTTSQEFAVQSYEVEATHYLLKPLSLSQLSCAIDRAIAAMQKNFLDFLIVATQQANIKILLNDIEFVEGKARKLIFHLTNKTVVTSKYYRGNFENNTENLLSKNYFVSTHSSYIINMNYVKKFNSNHFVMQSEKTIPIVRTRAQNVKNIYLDFLSIKRGNLQF